MPKINVYLPDDLAEAVRDAGIPVSAVCQAALARAVREATSLQEGDEAEPGTGGRRHRRERTGRGRDAGMERWTARAKRALELADEAAAGYGHDFVGTEHLLLGVLQEGGSLAIAVLAALDVEPHDLRTELEASMFPPSSEGSEGERPLTPRAKRALDLASREAARMAHSYLGCEHLLLGLVAEKEGVAGRVLRRMGVELRVTRRAVVDTLSGYLRTGATQPLTGRRSTRAAEKEARGPALDDIARRLEAIEHRLDGMERPGAGPTPAPAAGPGPEEDPGSPAETL